MRRRGLETSRAVRPQPEAGSEGRGTRLRCRDHRGSAKCGAPVSKPPQSFHSLQLTRFQSRIGSGGPTVSGCLRERAKSYAKMMNRLGGP